MEQRPRRRRQRKSPLPLLILILLLAIILVGLIFVIVHLENQSSPSDNVSVTTQPTTETTDPPTEPPTEPPIVKESSFTLSAMGDMLMHMPVVNTGYFSDTGSYNFDSIFRYIADYISAADYTAGNLETTLAGTNNGYSYSGYPQFNCPDGIIDGMKTAGFDMVLTANNHSYDTRTIGLTRTLQVIQERQLDYLGTKADPEEANFVVIERNGIRLGLACYTYEDNPSPNAVSPNGLTMSAQDAPLLNTFNYQELDTFYTEVTESIGLMDEQGADAVVFFIHWGYEYQITEAAIQNQMAQALCDLGVDVIIGGHPHVVQPVELLTSTKDETHKTVCLYSMGNAVSNQRRQNMNLNTGHTEDGVLFSVTFSRYSDGTVILESANCLPTWVNLRTNPDNGRREYNILPLDDQIEDWKTQFALTDSTLSSCQASYDRTMAIVGEGMTQVNTYLAQLVLSTETALGVK